MEDPVSDRYYTGSGSSFLVRWIVTSVAVAAAVLLVPGIEVTTQPLLTLIVVGAVLGFISTTLGTIIKFGAMGCIIMTLGVMNLVINAWLLMAAGTVVGWFGLGFYVTGFWPAFWGGVIISVVSTLLFWFLNPDA